MGGAIQYPEALGARAPQGRPPEPFGGLGLTGVRRRPEDLERAFFTTRFARVLDASGYARLKHWRIYGEEGLARREVALWLGTESLTVEYAGEPLSRYEVEHSSRSGHLRRVGSPKLFETSHRWGRPQPRLFPLDEAGWLKALRLEYYARRRPRRPEMVQQALFAYHEAWG